MNDDYANRREYARETLSLEAKVLAEGGETDVRVVDISIGGAKLRLAGEGAFPAKGEAVSLVIGQFGSYPAQVMWNRGETAGIHFTGDVDEVGELMMGLAVYA